MQDDIGLHLLACLIVLQGAPQIVTQTGLHLVVGTFRQSLTRQQIAQDDLSHVTAHLIVTPENICQTLCLLAQQLGLLHHLQHLLTERGRMGGTLLLILTDGLLHVADCLFQGLGDTCHRLRVRILQLSSTPLKHLLRHVHKLRITFLLFLLFLLTDLFNLLAHQLQFPSLTFSTGMQLSVLSLQMVNPTGSRTQLFTFHRELDVLLAALNSKHVHTAVHQEIKHCCTYCHTYYYI